LGLERSAGHFAVGSDWRRNTPIHIREDYDVFLKKFYLAIGLSALLVSSSFATPQSKVAAAIVFAVDRSSSMSTEDLSVQINAHAKVLRSAEFEEALAKDRCVGVYYLEWSGPTDAHAVLPWTVICSRAKAELAATAIEQGAGLTGAIQPAGSSSLAFAIDAASAAMKNAPFRADKKVIVISTGGADKGAVQATSSRDRASQKHYIVNAIAFGPAEPTKRSDLAGYLRRNVITGNGASALVAADSREYSDTMLMRTVVDAIRR
jgi:Protein of unknown function (DUF1194)